MKDLMNVQNVETMCSTEIAELTGKQHFHVLRDIEVMFVELEIGDSKIGCTYKTTQGKEVKCYNLNKELTLTLVSGYSIKLRNAIVKRWQELEKDNSIVKSSTVSVKEIAEVACIFADSLGVNEGSRILMYHKAMETVGVDSSFLPAYTEENVTISATEALKSVGSEISAIKFNKLMLEEGFLRIKERPSSGGKTKEYKSLTEIGKKYGKNLINPNSQRETQPHYFKDSFEELYKIVIK